MVANMAYAMVVAMDVLMMVDRMELLKVHLKVDMRAVHLEKSMVSSMGIKTVPMMDPEMEHLLLISGAIS